MTIRVAIYARYSSDQQREASIEDQVRVCRARADMEGWTVNEIYADYAISGASAGRPRFQQLIADARACRFEVILAEALDRISRDQEHIAGFHKQVSFAGARIVTIAEGDVSELHIGLKGTMSALFLKDLALKTHRGLEGRVRAGLSGGGCSFGYRVRRGLRPDGTAVRGEMEVVAEEAIVVRRIFTAYVSGQSPRSISKELNAENLPGPRGGQWSASLLLGGVARENGLLRNNLYVGERVWNRQHFIKDPTTGRRVSRPNPRAAWVIQSVENLAIIDKPLWQAAQERLNKMRRLVMPSEALEALQDGTPALNQGARLGAARRPRWLLSGLVRCGLCQGPMSVVANNGRLGCANHVERGTCSNRRTLLHDRLLPRVLAGLKHRLLTPDLVSEFARAYVAEVNSANRERGTRVAAIAGEQAKLARQIRNLVDLLKEGHGSPSMVAELRELERRQDELRTDLAANGAPEPLPTLHPNLPELYRRRVETLEASLRDPEAAAAAAFALRGLIDAILIYPGEHRGEMTIALRGDLAAFADLSEGGSDMLTGPSNYGRSGEVLGSVVAGMRNHRQLTLPPVAC